jgi:hypothetical protein
MANNRITVKIPRDAFVNLKNKKISMEQRFQQVYGNKKKLPMVKLIGFISNRPIYVEDNELKGLFKGKQIKRNRGFKII